MSDDFNSSARMLASMDGCIGPSKLETATRRAAEFEAKVALAHAEVAKATARTESALAAEKRRGRGRVEGLERRCEVGR